MPGVGQVWLTQEELDALLRAASDTHTRVSDRLWANLGPKLKEARDALGCPVPQRAEDGLPACLDNEACRAKLDLFERLEKALYPAREETDGNAEEGGSPAPPADH